MSSLAAQVVQIQASRTAQSIGTAVARQQIDAQKSVADMVAETAASASPPAPPGQGRIVDIRA